MVSATDFSGQSVGTEGAKPPKRRRFRLWAALAAPFRDVDERAVRRQRNDAIRNNSKGNMFASGVAAPATVAVKRLPQGID